MNKNRFKLTKPILFLTLILLGSIILSGAASAATTTTTHSNLQTNTTTNISTNHNKITTTKTITTKNTKTLKTTKTSDPYIQNTGDSYSTIQEAVDHAQSGDTIIIDPGTYTGTGNYNIQINKDLTLIGSNDTNNPTIIDAQGLGYIFTITAGVNVTLQYLTLINGNTANGGAITNYGTLTINNCTFTNNTANENMGGAINNDGTLTINNSTFTDNNANNDWGGAIYNTGTLTDTSNTFNDNSAYNGGAIYNDNNGILTETNSTFTNNTANYIGGALDNHGTITIENCTFTNNTATNDNGGAIYNEFDSPNTDTINNTTFTENNAQAGGAITNDSTLNINNNTFNSNTSQGSGGAIYNTGNLSLNASNFTNNNAQYYGGAVFTQNNLTINQCTFTNNTNTDPTYGNGGAIYNTYNLTCNNSNFTNNTADNVGGAIDNEGTLNDTYNTYNGNTATNNGGAIYNDGTLTDNNSTYTNNTAQYGGAIYNMGYQNDTNNTYTQNNASYNGGAIDNEGTLNETNNTFTNNTAINNNGGAIYTDDGCTLNETNSTLTNNTAPNGDGGAIYNDGTATVNFNQIIGNTATQGNQIYNDADGTMNATLNWWGTNTPNTNSNDIIGANYNPWIILTITANPTTILTGETSTITADLQHDENGYYYNPTIYGFIPYTSLVTFTTTLGTINNIYMINGIATTTLNTSNNPGTANVTATIDNQTVNTIVNIKQNPLITNTANQNTLNVGNNATFTITITNQGNNPLTNIQINDPLPNGFTANNPTIGNYNNGIWTITTLNQGNTTTLTFTGTITKIQAGTNITNTATETQNQPPYNINIPNATIHVNEANVTLSQTGGYSGNTVTFNVTTTNNGPDNGSNITVTDAIPSGLSNPQVTVNSGSYTVLKNVITWTIPSLAFGANATLTISGTANPKVTITNNANLTAQTEYNPYIPYTTSYSVYVPSVDINAEVYPWYYVVATGDELYTYNVGNTPEITVDIWNQGPDDATGVVYNIDIGSGLLFGGSSTTQGTVTYNNSTNSLVWDIGNIPNNGELYLKILVMMIQSGDGTPNLTLNASLAQCNQYDTNPSTDGFDSCSLISTSSAADVAVNQTQTVTNQGNTQYITYTIAASNNGPDNATGVTIKDTLPSGATLTSSNVPAGTTYSGGVWSIPSLADGANITLTLTFKITATTGTIRNTVTKTGETQLDPNMNNNAQTLTYSITGTYTPRVDINAEVYPWYYVVATGDELYTYNVGNTPEITVDIWNQGPDDATGVVYNIDIGSGLLFGGSSTTQGTVTYNNSTNSLVWDIGNIPNNGELYLKILVMMIQSGDGTPNLTLNASLAQCNQYDTNPSTDGFDSCSLISTSSAADVAVNQTQTVTNQGNTQYITYTIAASNNGPDNATGVTIKDTLPSGATLTSSNVPAGTTYSGGVWSIPSLADGANITLTLTFKITATTGTIRNTVTKTGETQLDPNMNNNAQTLTYSIP